MNQTAAPGGPSLRNRLTWTVLGSVGLVWLVVIVATWVDTRHELDELLDAHLSQAASLLVSRPLDDLNRTVFPDAPVLHSYQSKVVVQVWHHDSLVVRSATAPLQPLAPNAQRGLTEVSLDGQSWRVFSAPGRDPDVVVHVAEQADLRADVLDASLRGVLWPVGIALPLLGLVIWWAVRRAVQPLQSLGTVVTQRPPGGLDPLPTHDVPLEARPLVDALNRLFARTAELMDAERRFTADAAHELRTPMAAIRMQAQVAQGATQAAERDDALAATVRGCDRATHLMEQLLQLARLEGQDALPSGGCDLSACIRAVLNDLQPMALRRSQHLHWAPPAAAATSDQPVAWVESPAGLTTVLVRNLVDNALRYSPPGGRVRLRIETPADLHAAPVRLVLQDSGPGLSPADLARLGERFFRVLGSGEAGSGLGWSIVTRIARLYSLTVAVTRSAELGGLRVSVTWPTTESQK